MEYNQLHKNSEPTKMEFPTRKKRSFHLKKSKSTRTQIRDVGALLKQKYNDYVKKIDRKKNCKKMTFKEFVDKRIGKPLSRKNKKNGSMSLPKKNSKEPTAIETPAEETSNQAEETSNQAEETSNQAEETSTQAEETGNQAEEKPKVETQSPPQVESPGIMKSMSNAFGIASEEKEEKKTGGKKKQMKSKR